MAQPKTGSGTQGTSPTGNNSPSSSPGSQQNSPGGDAVCEQLRASIRRLQAELAERQAEARPMPSSVMRAYQKLIDRHFAELDQNAPNPDTSEDNSST